MGGLEDLKKTTNFITAAGLVGLVGDQEEGEEYITIWGLGEPEEDHQLHHCCWTGRVGDQEEEEYITNCLLKYASYW